MSCLQISIHLLLSPYIADIKASHRLQRDAEYNEALSIHGHHLVGIHRTANHQYLSSLQISIGLLLARSRFAWNIRYKFADLAAQCGQFCMWPHIVWPALEKQNYIFGVGQLGSYMVGKSRFCEPSQTDIILIVISHLQQGVRSQFWKMSTSIYSPNTRHVSGN